jgi:hypothetical protein
MKNQNIVIACAVTAVVAGGAGFWGGTMYPKSQSMPNFQNRGEGRPMMPGQTTDARPSGNRVAPGSPGQMGRGGAIMGEVTAKDDKSITIKMSDGSSKIVILSSSTSYRTSTESKAANVELGKQVAVFGTPNSDGSTTASSVEIDPIMMGQMAK